MDIVLCEFSGAVAGRIAASGRAVLAVDASERDPDANGGLYYEGDVRDVIDAREWDRCVAHPPCEHQAVSAARYMRFKAVDGRLFWGSAFALYCHCVGKVNLTEQPRTYWDLFYPPALTQEVHPYHFGDDRQKKTRFYLRGAAAAIPRTRDLGEGDRTWHKRRFETPEEGYRFRSKLLPGMADAIASHLAAAPKPAACLYLREVEVMARRFFAAGLPVPHDYRNADARPSSSADREYLLRKGDGDGRFVSTPVAPLSLRPPLSGGREPPRRTWRRQDVGTEFRPLRDDERPALPAVLSHASAIWAARRAGAPPPPPPASLARLSLIHI